MSCEICIYIIIIILTKKKKKGAKEEGKVSLRMGEKSWRRRNMEGVACTSYLLFSLIRTCMDGVCFFFLERENRGNFLCLWLKVK